MGKYDYLAAFTKDFYVISDERGMQNSLVFNVSFKINNVIGFFQKKEIMNNM